jgi:hydrogenase maturation protein HypF
LHDAFEGAPPIDELALFQGVPSEARRLVAQMLERDLNAPAAHGVGRYFDAFGALGLGRPVSSYEGQVAVAWDFTADASASDAYPFEIDRGTAPIEIDLRPAVRAMVEDLRGRVAPGVMSARFHRTLVDASAGLAAELLRQLGPLPVGLTGGVFQNERLCAGIEAKLRHEYEVLRHREVPPGDGGIAVGQALIAAAFLGDKG